MQRTLPHDEKHFTQGLIYRDGRLYESAGGYAKSGLYEKKLASGTSLRTHPLSPDVFAEGLARIGGEFFLLTWRNGYGYVFDAAFREKRRFPLDTEGWGLTDDGHQLVLSDGSPVLRWLDPLTGKVLRRVMVSDNGVPVAQLNELEQARGLIYANVWHSNRVAVIAPQDGHVAAWIDFSALRQNLRKPPHWDEQEHVLNGIAYDAAHDLFYITGKCWPLLYEVRISALPPAR